MAKHTARKAAEEKESDIDKYSSLIDYFSRGLTPEKVSDEKLPLTITEISSRLQKSPEYRNLDTLTRNEIARAAIRKYRSMQKQKTD